MRGKPCAMGLALLCLLSVSSLAPAEPLPLDQSPPSLSPVNWTALDSLLTTLETEAQALNGDSSALRLSLGEAQMRLTALSSKLAESQTEVSGLSLSLARSESALQDLGQSLKRLGIELWAWRGASALLAVLLGLAL